MSALKITKKGVEDANGIPVFIFDNSVIQKILEGESTIDSKVLVEVERCRRDGLALPCFTTSANFFNALYRAEKIDMKSLRMFLDNVNIAPSIRTNFKDEKEVMHDTILFAETFSEVANHFGKLKRVGD